MTEHDGLTAEQEAERLYPMPSPTSRGGGRTITFARQLAFVDGAEWATEREKGRAEAAEARVAELEAALLWAYDRFPPEMHPAIHPVLDAALAAPTTEAVTEVEGS